MSYIDGFVAAVPTKSKETYTEYAKGMAEVFKDNGALKVVDTWGDDVPEGDITSFPMAVQKKDDETVAFSWIVWPSKETREAGWQTAMEDPRMNAETNPMPFDGKRIIFGGFNVISDL